jgi:hypothetical protein
MASVEIIDRLTDAGAGSAGEKFPDLVHEGLGARIVALGVVPARFLQLAEQFLLPLGQLDRRLDDDVAKQIAKRLTAHTTDAFSA